MWCWRCADAELTHDWLDHDHIARYTRLGGLQRARARAMARPERAAGWSGGLPWRKSASCASGLGTTQPAAIRLNSHGAAWRRLASTCALWLVRSRSLGVAPSRRRVAAVQLGAFPVACLQRSDLAGWWHAAHHQHGDHYDDLLAPGLAHLLARKIEALVV